MAFTESDVLTRLDDLLLDASRVRWPVAERRRWILDAQRTIVATIPGAGPVFETTLTLAAGVLQEVAAEVDSKTVARIADFLYNVTSGGAIGVGVRRIGRDQLDTQRPGWPAQAATGVVKYVMPVDGEPRRFAVYPPAGSGATACRLRVSLSQMPSAADGTIYVRDAFMSAVTYHSAALCHLKDDTPSVKSEEWMRLWLAEMTVQPGADVKALERIYKRVRDYGTAGAVPNTTGAMA